MTLLTRILLIAFCFDQAITNWLNYRLKNAKVVASSPSNEGAMNPVAANLAPKATASSTTGGKLLCDWQLWSKAQFGAHQQGFEDEFAKSGLPASTHKACMRVAYIQRIFDTLPADERLRWQEEAAVAKANKPAKVKKKKETATALLDPASAQQ